jgi:regulator of sigma E protease
MIEVVQSVLALIVTLSILVTFHELGHYMVARMCNVHVIRFSVGFGKPLFMRRGKPPAHVAPPPEQEIGTRSNEPIEGTEFVIAGIPLGGYVKFLDEREGYVPDDQLHLAFNRKPLFQRVAIVAAGPIANFLLAIAAYWLLFTIGVPGMVPLLGEIDPASAAGRAGLEKGQEIVQVDDEQTRTWSDVNMQLFSRIGDTGQIEIIVREEGSNDSLRSFQIAIHEWLSTEENPYPTGDLGLVLNYPPTPAVIGGLVKGGAAKEAGILVKDEVIEFNGRKVGDWSDFVKFIQSHPEKVVRLSLRREGQVVVIPVMPKSIERDGRRIGFLGASPQRVELPESMRREVRYEFYSAWIPAVKKTWSVTVMTFESIGKMIRGAISPKNLSGPITIAQIASATAQSGFTSFVSFIALLSISLGVLNLLPIPILDGGHLLYYLVEFIIRRPVPERVQMWGLQMGVFVIVSIMLLAFYNDLMRL